MSRPGDPGVPMNAGRFREVKEALLRAGRLGPTERARFLADLGTRDEALRREVESLLEAGDHAAAILETGAVAALEELIPGETRDSAMPERIGPYRLLGVLGEGGMGIVYHAEQQEPIRREVALKVVRGGYAPEWVISRFDAERQALAIMNHPNIASVFDAGADESGQLWFSMERVPGVPLTTYCDEQGLDIRARLTLFLQLCDAIRHAHQKGVIHRDLKPSNVLVAGSASGPLLKVIDFGIAKVLGPAAGATLTRPGFLVGTPSYMSPEQCGAIDAPVDTRSDVYALGVILYELLCGARPFGSSGDDVSPVDIRRAQSEGDPQRPSARLSNPGESPAAATEVARARGTTATRLRREVTGDLDNIALMALRREPDRRYASVEQLASDVRRHLEGLPVLARPDTWRYRSEKFVRRHRTGVTIGTAAVMVAIGFMIALAAQSRRLAVERNLAIAAQRREQNEAAVAHETADFLSGLFEGADPDTARGLGLTARQLLDRGARRLDTELHDRPAVRARLLVTLGKVYLSLADYPRSEALAESALAIQLSLKGADDEALANTLALLSDIAHDRRDMPASARYAREALELRRRRYGERSAEVATSMNALAIPLRAMGQFAAAESLLRQALAIHRETLQPDDPKLASDLGMLGYVRYSRGDAAEAEDCFRGALLIERRTVHPPNSDLAGALNNLGGIQMVRGRAAAAESTFGEALDMYRQLYGENHPAVARAYHNLGNAVREGGRDAEAEPLLFHALALFVRLVGPSHEFVATTLVTLGSTRRDLGDFAGADSCLGAALAIRRRVFGPAPEREKAAVEMAQAELAFDRGDAERAVLLARDALQPIETTLPGDDGRVARGRLVLGESLTRAGHPAEAESLLTQALGSLGRTMPPDHWRIAEARSALGACLLALGRRNDAWPELQAGLQGLQQALGAEDVRLRLAESRRAKFGTS